MLQLNKIIHLRGTFKSKGFCVDWNNYYSWYAEASKRLQAPNIVSLKNLLKKLMKKLKTQVFSKTEDSKTNVTPSAPFCAALPE